MEEATPLDPMNQDKTQSKENSLFLKGTPEML